MVHGFQSSKEQGWSTRVAQRTPADSPPFWGPQTAMGPVRGEGHQGLSPSEVCHM